MSGIDLTHLKLCVVQPVLAAFPARYNTRAAEILLLGTGEHESAAGEYLRQIGGGPALGWLEIEPATHNDIWANFLNFQPDLAAAVRKFMVPDAGSGQMTWNLAYCAAIGRADYIRAKPPLPAEDDYAGMATYYKAWFNSSQGKAVVDADLVDCFRRAAAA